MAAQAFGFNLKSSQREQLETSSGPKRTTPCKLPRLLLMDISETQSAEHNVLQLPQWTNFIVTLMQMKGAQSVNK